MPIHDLHGNLTGGELSPSLYARTDLEKFSSGLALCSNYTVHAQGGVSFRPGFRFIGESASTGITRIISFQFNVEQAYMLELTHLKLRVIRNGGYVLDGGAAIYEAVTPYADSDLFDLKFTQSADVMTIVSSLYPPTDLTRLDHDDWTFTVIDFMPSTIAPSSGLAISNGGTGGGSNNRDYEYVVTTVGESDGQESEPSAKLAITGIPSLSTTAYVKLDWNAVPGADYYNIYKADSVGSNVYGWIGRTETQTFRDYNFGPDMGTPPPEYVEPFASNNNPSTVNYYQQRLLFAATVNEPQRLIASSSGFYDLFKKSIPTVDDDRVDATIASNQVNEIRHLVSLQNLIILTSGGEWLTTEGENDVLTPATIGFKQQSYIGASNIQPVVVGNTALFVQENGGSVFDLSYSFDSDSYSGNELSILAEHLFEGRKIVSWCYARNPDSIVWAVCDDGVLLGLTFQREHNVWGWHQHSTDGLFECVASISEDDRDAVYAVVQRFGKRYIERLEPQFRDSSEDAFHVDSGLSYTGTPVSVVSGLDHLEGAEVVTLNDGNVERGHVVSGGSITLNRPGSVIHVGLSYAGTIQPLPLEFEMRDGTAQGRRKSISKLVVRVNRSRGMWAGPRLDDLVEVKQRSEDDNYNNIDLFSGDFEITIPAGWSRDGRFYIQQLDPLPQTILAIIPEVTIGGS